MKLGMELPVWLGNDEYYLKTQKFLDYYTQGNVMNALGLKDTKDIWLVENASSPGLSTTIKNIYGVSIKRYDKHLTRTAHLEYPYCWRGLYFCRDLFQEHDYDKMIHLNNDVYILSPKLATHVKDFKSGWWSPWCTKHAFKECDLQVITKDSKEFWEVTAPPYITYNGRAMEHVIKSPVDKTWNGDRHSEYGITVQDPAWDYSCQVRFDMKMEFNKK